MLDLYLSHNVTVTRYRVGVAASPQRDGVLHQQRRLQLAGRGVLPHRLIDRRDLPAQVGAQRQL